MILIRGLTPEDAQAVGDVEASLHLAELADGAESHQGYLREATAEGVNLSFGLFDGNRLVGYLLCYGFEPSCFSDQQDEVLYVEDIAVLPRFRRQLPRLFKRFTDEAKRRFPGVPVEAHALDGIFQHWQEHSAFFSRLGFRLDRHADAGHVINGQTQYLLRWEPVFDIEDSARALPDVLASLPGRTIDIDGNQFVLKLLEETSDWGALAARWDELLVAVEGHTVFQSYAYQRLWWRHFGGNNNLFIVLVTRGDTILGIAPFQIRTVTYFGQKSRELSFIGSRWEVDRPTLLFPPADPEMIRALVAFLGYSSSRWDICQFHEQITTSPALRCLEDEFRAAGCVVGRARDSNCPYLKFEGTWSEFLKGKSQTFRKNLKTAARRLREAGEVGYEVCDTIPDVLRHLERYRELETRSWKAGEGVGVGRNPRYFAFYREMAQLFGRKRAFAIRMLSVGENAIAGTFGLEFHGVYYSLQIVHDREFSRCSPGTYLEALEMEECYGRGYREYEFLGGFLNNKSRWTQSFRQTTQLHVYQPKPRLVALYVLMFRIKPLVKDLVRPFMKSWRQVEHD